MGHNWGRQRERALTAGQKKAARDVLGFAIDHTYASTSARTSIPQSPDDIVRFAGMAQTQHRQMREARVLEAHLALAAAPLPGIPRVADRVARLEPVPPVLA